MPLTLEEQRHKAISTGEGLGQWLAQVDRPVQLINITALPTKRDNRKYAAAQVNEKPAFKRLLAELVKTIPSTSDQVNGRPRLDLQDVLFSCVYKCYLNVSGRRFISDLDEIKTSGLIHSVPSYNSISNYLRNSETTPILRALIQGVAASFAHIESDFAIDSTGLRIPRISKWHDAKYGWRKRRQWLKCHVMVGVKSHIIASVEITNRRIMDHSRVPALMDQASGFSVKQIAADAGYSMVKTREHIEDSGSFGAIPFKSNTNPFRHAKTSTWYRMYHLFALNSENWQCIVGQQNQAESAFSMIKRKFGERVLSKSDTGQENEILCKVLCHNLCVFIYWLYQFGVEESEI